MDPATSSDQLDLTFQLPRDIYYQIVHTLRTGLPPPVTSAGEDLTRRDNAAIAAVASLCPPMARRRPHRRPVRRCQRPGDGLPAAGPRLQRIPRAS
jgi:hypothetical protein